MAGNLCHRAWGRLESGLGPRESLRTDLPHRPRDAAMLSEHYVEALSVPLKSLKRGREARKLQRLGPASRSDPAFIAHRGPRPWAWHVAP